MTSRLITAATRSATLSAWLAKQRAAIAAEAEASPIRHAAEPFQRTGSQSLLRVGSQPNLQGVRYLVPATATLGQVRPPARPPPPPPPSSFSGAEILALLRGAVPVL